MQSLGFSKWTPRSSSVRAQRLAHTRVRVREKRASLGPQPPTVTGNSPKFSSPSLLPQFLCHGRSKECHAGAFPACPGRKTHFLSWFFVIEVGAHHIYDDTGFCHFYRHRSVISMTEKKFIRPKMSRMCLFLYCKWVSIQRACSWRPRAFEEAHCWNIQANFYNENFPLVYESDKPRDSLSWRSWWYFEGQVWKKDSNIVPSLFFSHFFLSSFFIWAFLFFSLFFGFTFIFYFSSGVSSWLVGES